MDSVQQEFDSFTHVREKCVNGKSARWLSVLHRTERDVAVVREKERVGGRERGNTIRRMDKSRKTLPSLN